MKQEILTVYYSTKTGIKLKVQSEVPREVVASTHVVLDWEVSNIVWRIPNRVTQELRNDTYRLRPKWFKPRRFE